MHTENKKHARTVKKATVNQEENEKKKNISMFSLAHVCELRTHQLNKNHKFDEYLLGGDCFKKR